jgi:hypothetical protein
MAAPTAADATWRNREDDKYEMPREKTKLKTKSSVSPGAALSSSSPRASSFLWFLQGGLFHGIDTIEKYLHRVFKIPTRMVVGEYHSGAYRLTISALTCLLVPLFQTDSPFTLTDLCHLCKA